MGGTRDLSPSLAAAARERAPAARGEGHKRLSVRLQSRWNTTRRDLCRDNRDLHKNRREEKVPRRRQRTLRPLMMRMATRKDSSSVHAPLSRYASRCRAARTSGVCACGVCRRLAGGMRRTACCIT